MDSLVVYLLSFAMVNHSTKDDGLFLPNHLFLTYFLVASVLIYSQNQLTPKTILLEDHFSLSVPAYLEPHDALILHMLHLMDSGLFMINFSRHQFIEN